MIGSVRTLLLLVLIPAGTTLQLLQERNVFQIIRLHIDRRLSILLCCYIITHSVIGVSIIIEPSCRMIGNTVENVDRLCITAAADVIQSSVHVAVVLTLTCTGASIAALTVGLTAITVPVAAISLTSEVSVGILLFILDLLIRLLDFLELFFGIRIALIDIRVIFSTHCTVLFFQFFVGDTSLDT